MKKPNFFIIGAPKCGTTALVEYLKKSPEIFIPEVKEPHFFATDISKEYREPYLELETYEALFADAGSNHLAVGEASVLYLFSQEALRNIFHYNKDAKIIIMLRNPIEQVESQHAQFLYTFTEEIGDIQVAWDLQPRREKGEGIPKHCLEPKLLQYRALASYYEQVKRVLDIFPKSQVKVVIFDDFKQQTQDVFNDVLQFLGVPVLKMDSFERVNERKAVRFKLLARFFFTPPRWVFTMQKKLKELIGIKSFGVANIINRLNKRESQNAMSPAFKKELAAVFKEDVEKLSVLLERDLTHWVEGIDD